MSPHVYLTCILPTCSIVPSSDSPNDIDGSLYYYYCRSIQTYDHWSPCLSHFSPKASSSGYAAFSSGLKKNLALPSTWVKSSKYLPAACASVKILCISVDSRHVAFMLSSATSVKVCDNSYISVLTVKINTPTAGGTALSKSVIKWLMASSRE